MCKQIAQKRINGVLIVEKGDKIMGNTLNIFVKLSLILTVAVPALYLVISFSNMVESSETGKNGISMARYTELTGEQFSSKRERGLKMTKIYSDRIIEEFQTEEKFQIENKVKKNKFESIKRFNKLFKAYRVHFSDWKYIGKRPPLVSLYHNLGY